MVQRACSVHANMAVLLWACGEAEHYGRGGGWRSCSPHCSQEAERNRAKVPILKVHVPSNHFLPLGPLLNVSTISSCPTSQRPSLQHMTLTSTPGPTPAALLSSGSGVAHCGNRLQRPDYLVTGCCCLVLTGLPLCPIWKCHQRGWWEGFYHALICKKVGRVFQLRLLYQSKLPPMDTEGLYFHSLCQIHVLGIILSQIWLVLPQEGG